MIEAIEIRNNKNNFHKDKGFKMSNTWIPEISGLKTKRSQENSRNSKKQSREREKERF